MTILLLIFVINHVNVNVHILFAATKVQIACMANGIAAYLKMVGPAKRTFQEVARSESGSSSECSSIIERAITATGFDFTDMSDMR